MSSICANVEKVVKEDETTLLDDAALDAILRDASATWTESDQRSLETLKKKGRLSVKEFNVFMALNQKKLYVSDPEAYKAHMQLSTDGGLEPGQ